MTKNKCIITTCNLLVYKPFYIYKILEFTVQLHLICSSTCSNHVTHTHTHTHTHKYTHTHTHTNTHTHSCILMHVQLYTHTHTHTYIHVATCTQCIPWVTQCMTPYYIWQYVFRGATCAEKLTTVNAEIFMGDLFSWASNTHEN